MKLIRLFYGSFKSELLRLIRSPIFILLTTIQSITFIFLVYFFGTTGAFAPTALVNYDRGYYSKIFIEKLEQAHHSFTLKPMDETTAMNLVKKGKIVAVIIIPPGFSEAVDAGETTPIKVIVDNIDTDMTADIQRAIPAAIVAFGKDLKLPDIHVRPVETDLIDHETGFIPYLTVSALALSALIVAGILAGVSIAYEFESRNIDMILSSPANLLVVLFGKIVANDLISAFTMTIALGIAIYGHGINPVHPWQTIAGLILCISTFGFMGGAVGMILKKTHPTTTLIFGISLPLYLFSGTYEPERFDGNIIWTLAHFTPLYYAVGILEHAMLGLKVTPEPLILNYIALTGWGVAAILIAGRMMHKTSYD